MKLRNKLLTALVPAAVVVTATPMVLTNCGGDSDNSISFAGESQTIDKQEDTLPFTLEKALSDGQKLTCKVNVTEGNTALCSDPVVNGKDVTVHVQVYNTGSVHYSRFNLEFTCYENLLKEKVVWTSTVSGFWFRYV